MLNIYVMLASSVSFLFFFFLIEEEIGTSELFVSNLLLLHVFFAWCQFWKKYMLTSVYSKICAHLYYYSSVKYSFIYSFHVGKENRNKQIHGFFLYHILYRFLRHMVDYKMLLIRYVLFWEKGKPKMKMTYTNMAH